MKHHLFLGALVIVLLAGCGGEAEDDNLVPSVPSATSADPLAGGTPAAAPEAAPDPATLLKPAETMIDFSTAERPVDDNGKTMDDLAYLNNLVFNINEGRATYVSDVIVEFRTDAEREAYEAALAKAKEPVKDLDELVRMKVIKAIPPAPAGKRYAINSASGKVELVAQ